MMRLDYNNLHTDIINIFNESFKNDENKKRLVCCYCSDNPEKELSVLSKYFNITKIMNDILKWLSTNLLEYQPDWTRLKVKQYMERNKLINEKYFCFVDTNYHRLDLNIFDPSKKNNSEAYKTNENRKSALKTFLKKMNLNI